MKYGNFSKKDREYIITNPQPPRDWFNILWNPTYLASVSQNLNGFSLYQSEDGVLTNLFGKQDQRNAPRNIYIKDNDTQEIWSAAFKPTFQKLDKYTCRHGLGYSILESIKNDIKVRVQIFVPRNEAAEIWSISINNLSKQKRNLSVYSVAEIVLDGVNFTYGYNSAVDAYHDNSKNRLFFRNRATNVINEKYRAFSYTDVPYDHFDISKEIFLGHTLNYCAPQTILNGNLQDSDASTELMVSALQHNIRLEQGQTKRINIVLGVVDNEEDADRVSVLFANSNLIDKELEAVKQNAVKRLGLTEINTPDNDFNNLFNTWLKHQMFLMADWARFYFKGYRDTLQDAAGISIIDNQRALEMLEKALRNQKSNGFCPRAFRVPSMDVAAADKHYSDSPSWISHATEAILKESGDLSILDRMVEYSDGGKASIWEHNLKAIEFLWKDRGEHGLSLIRHGDWNDLMDKVGAKGKGEGVWMSFALARALKIIAKIASWKGDKDIETLYNQRYEELKNNILKFGWDEDHFIYAYTDSGNKVGNNASKEGKVFLNPQSWAMLSGIIDEQQYKNIMKKIEPVVDTPVGPVHNWPPFTEYNPEIGTITGIPQGNFTNGNVYCHAASFKVAADYLAGRNDKAFDTFKKILPSEEKSEPYAQANAYVGPTAFRKNRNVSDDPWRTGTVAWNLINCFDNLLGFKRDLKGFYIEPKIPSHWNNLSYIRTFRNNTYKINIKQSNINKIIVDGKIHNGNFIELTDNQPLNRVITIDVFLKSKKNKEL